MLIMKQRKEDLKNEILKRRFEIFNLRADKWDQIPGDEFFDDNEKIIDDRYDLLDKENYKDCEKVIGHDFYKNFCRLCGLYERLYNS